MVSKKILAGILSVAMCITSVVIVDNVNHKSENQVDVETQMLKNGDMDIKTEGVFGNYITKTMAEKSENESGNVTLKDFIVTGAAFDAQTGKLEVITSQPLDCKIKVNFLTDDDQKLNFYTVSEEVKAGQNVVTECHVNASSLKEYYSIEVILVGTLGEKLSNAYYLNDYTESMQEILNSNIHDFNEEQVVNFDESEDTNFVVLSEETVIAESTETQNLLVSADYDNGEYVFENTDDTISLLESGDYFFINANAEEIVAIEVADVKVEDGKTIITDAGNSDEVIDEMFEFIKFESYSVMDMQTVGLDNSSFEKIDVDENSEEETNSDELQDILVPDDAINEDIVNGMTESDLSELSYIYPMDTVKASNGLVSEQRETIKAGGDNFSISGTVSLGATYELDFYKNKKDIEIRFSLTPTIKLELSANASVKAGSSPQSLLNATLFDIKFSPFVGATIAWTPKLTVSLSGRATVKYTISRTIGFYFNSKTGISDIQDPGDVDDLSVEVVGMLSIGFDISPHCVLIHDKIADFSLKSVLAVNFTGKESETVFTDGQCETSTNKYIYCIADNEAEEVHLCENCIDGDITLTLEIGISVKIFEKLKFEHAIAKITFPLGEKLSNWHYSFSKGKYGGLGFGECENIGYQVTMTAKKDGEKYINCEAVIDGKTVQPNQNGDFIWYSPSNKKYDIRVVDKAAENKASSCVVKCNVEESKVGYTADLYSDKTISPSFSEEKGVPKEKDTYQPDLSKPIKIEGEKKDVQITPGHTIIEAGALGDNITYLIYEDGFMEIIGYGEMYNYAACNSEMIDTGGKHSPLHGDKNIKEVIIENADEENGKIITSIGDRVFEELLITSVEMPDTIETIGNGAFWGCSELTNIDLPESLISINDAAFKKCSELRELLLPNKLEYIGINAFSNCVNLIDISICENVEEIKSGAFSGCTGLTSIKIPDNTKYIEHDIFNGCVNLTELTLPDAKITTRKGVNYQISDIFSNLMGMNDGYAIRKIVITGGECIPKYAFDDMNMIEEIVLPGTIKSIDERAFNNCTKLKNINITENITSIGIYAFENCSSLQEIKLPSGLLNIDSNAFNGCSSLLSIEIPDTVTNIGRQAFYSCTGITEITFPKSVKTIGNEVLKNCTNLKKVTIEEGVETIGLNIFNGCKSLEELVLPYAGRKDEPSTGKYYFNQISDMFSSTEGSGQSTTDGYQIKKITVTGGETVYVNAFSGIDTLVEINLPDTIKAIEDYAFRNCSSLSEIKLPSGLLNIGSSAFNGCSSLLSIEIPETVTNIGSSAFTSCAMISEIVVPGSVKTIGNEALKNCTNLKKVTIEEGVETIGLNIFNGCKSLEELVLPYAGRKDEPSTGKYYFNQISDMFSSTEGSGQSSTDGYPIKKITVTGGETIYVNAFSGIDTLVEINLPDTVKTLELYAIRECSALEKVVIKSMNTTFGKNCFYNIDDFTIHCYTNSDAHKYAESNGIKYVLLDELPATTEPVPPTEPDKPVQPDEITHTYIYGDINNDSSIDLMDLTYLSLHLLGDREIDEITLKYADVCGDNNGVDIADLAFLKQYIMKDPMAILPVSDAA